MTIIKREIPEVEDEQIYLTLSDGTVLLLSYDDTMTRVRIFHDGEKCGEIGFELRSEETSGPGQDVQVARLVHLFNEQFAGHGVGTEAVKWFLFQAGLDAGALEFADDDGIRRDDGSHLTGNGPAFAASLKRKAASGALDPDYENVQSVPSVRLNFESAIAGLPVSDEFKRLPSPHQQACLLRLLERLVEQVEAQGREPDAYERRHLGRAIKCAKGGWLDPVPNEAYLACRPVSARNAVVGGEAIEVPADLTLRQMLDGA